MLCQFLYMEVFALIGAVLGFWTLRDKPGMERRNWEMFKSVSVGMFTAFIVYILVVIKVGEVHLVGMALSGGFAFGGTDAGIKLYQKISGEKKHERD